MEKGSELPKGNPQRKFKGRAVFLGDNVKDEHFNWAEFADLGSSPPTMEAARALDAIGCLEGYSVKTGDARGAYTQAYLRGCKTWVALPRERWPDSWVGVYTCPMVPLVMSLYGHPDAGGYWEQHCEERVLSLGFERVHVNWPSTFWHPKKRALLIVYVDDFKLAARDKDHDAIWTDLKAVIDMDDESYDGRFLGCEHESFESTTDVVHTLLESQPHKVPRENKNATDKEDDGEEAFNPNDLFDHADVPPMTNGKRVRGKIYNMEEFAAQCVEQFCELTGYKKENLHYVATPFIDESTEEHGCLIPEPTEALASTVPKGKSRPKSKAKAKVKGKSPAAPAAKVKAKTKAKADSTDATKAKGGTGTLASVSCKCLMKIMYLARFGRFDLLRAVGALTTQITKWTRVCVCVCVCDLKLLRLIKHCTTRRVFA